MAASAMREAAKLDKLPTIIGTLAKMVFPHYMVKEDVVKTHLRTQITHHDYRGV